jgi:hypothetical protein
MSAIEIFRQLSKQYYEILRNEQQRLHVPGIIFAGVIPGKPALLVWPETLHQREWIFFVEPQRVADVVSIVLTRHLPKHTLIRVLEDVGVFFSRLVTFSGLNLLPDHGDYAHTSVERKAKKYYLGVAERVEQSY